MHAETKILIEPSEISCRFHGGRKASGIVIPHMTSCLVDIGCSLKRCLVILKNQYPLFLQCTESCRIQAIQAGSDNDFIIILLHKNILPHELYNSFLHLCNYTWV